MQNGRFVVALSAVHNFLNNHGQRAEDEPYELEDQPERDPIAVADAASVPVGTAHTRRRDMIAAEMWQQYRRRHED